MHEPLGTLWTEVTPPHDRAPVNPTPLITPTGDTHPRHRRLSGRVAGLSPGVQVFGVGLDVEDLSIFLDVFSHA